MTWNNHNPLANPLNQMARKAIENKHITYTKDNKSLQVPNQDVPLYGSQEWEERFSNNQSSLTVPNQDIPFGDQLYGNGFIPGSNNLFRLSDGTIINFKTGKIIKNKFNQEKSQYWNNPNQTITFGTLQSYNSSKNEFISIINKATSIDKTDDIKSEFNELNNNLDLLSIQYWLKAQEEAEKLKDNMTQQQLDAIKEFENHFPKSKLIEESKKIKLKK